MDKKQLAELQSQLALQKTGQLTPEQSAHLADAAAGLFMQRWLEEKEIDYGAIAIIGSLISDDDEKISESATKPLFEKAIEPLMDSFLPENRRAYDLLFIRLVDILRHFPSGKKLDGALDGMGCPTEEAMRKRAEKAREARPLTLDKKKIRKVFVLSRVTIGADIAVTSVVLKYLQSEMPDAEILFLAPKADAAQLFSFEGVVIEDLPYPRRGAFAGRLQSWISCVELLEKHTKGLSGSEFLIADPDSRITQLGLLPMTGSLENYLFFNPSLSSDELEGGKAVSLAAAANAWLNKIFGKEKSIHPSVNVRKEDAAFARKVFDVFSLDGNQAVAIKLGVGGNDTKRVGDEFELDLAREILTAGKTIIIDAPQKEKESVRADSIAAALEKEGIRAARVMDVAGQLSSAPAQKGAQVLLFNRARADLGRFAATMALCRQFISYNSMGQHLAGALGLDGVAVFAGCPSPRFTERWTPTGKGNMRVVSAGNGPFKSRQQKEILRDTMAAYGGICLDRQTGD